jgi:hypothetical protein
MKSAAHMFTYEIFARARCAAALARCVAARQAHYLSSIRTYSRVALGVLS